MNSYNETVAFDDEELEIDFLDLVGRLIEKWRKILLLGVIGLVISGAAAAAIGYVNLKSANREAKIARASKKIALVEEKLLEDENGEELKISAENNLTNYSNITALYEMQKDYLDHSIYHKLDANHVAKATLTYYIDNKYVNKYPVVNTYNNIGDITNAYIVEITSDSICNEIITELGLDTEVKYIRELISCYVSSTSNIVIHIVAENEEMASAIAKYYVNKMPRITKNISSNFGSVDCVLQNNQIVTESDMGIRINQNAEENKLVEYYKNSKDIENSMSGNQLDYFKAIQSKYNFENVKKDDKQYGYLHYVPKKVIALGCVAFLFLVCAYYGVLYLLDGKIKTGDELSMMSGSFLLGTILTVDDTKKKKNAIFDRWAKSLTEKHVMCKDAAVAKDAVITSIAELINKNEYKNLVLVGSGIENKALVEEIADKVSSEIKVSVAVEKVLDSNEIKDISNADAFVVVGEIQKTKRQELQHAIEMCYLYNKKAVGAIAIQEAI